jgi:hypothetical protein
MSNPRTDFGIKEDLVKWLDPAALKMHWTRKQLPVPAKDSEAVHGLSDDIARRIQLPPIYIVEPNLVVAGWSRVLAHRAQQCERIACIAITEEEAPLVALKENTNRQVLPKKFQVAWVYTPLALTVIQTAEQSRIQALKAGPNSRESKTGLTGMPGTLNDLADDLHVSRSLLADVVGAYRKIEAWDKENKPQRWGEDKQPKTAMEHANEMILHPETPCTPGNIVAGLGGKDAAVEGKTKPVPKQLELFCDGLDAVRKWGKAFPKWEGEERKIVVGALKKTVAAWPKELRDELSQELNRLRREEKEQEPAKN